MVKLKKEFYTRADTVKIGKELLGKVLCSRFQNEITKGIICETEAYCGPTDRGAHSYNGRFTDRTKIMYEEGGVAYVYICYGIHHLFNIITHDKNEPHAILIRAIEPVEGFETILKRTSRKIMDHTIAAGPGLVSQCLGFKKEHTGISLLSDAIWVEDAKPLPEKNIVKSARVGMNFEGEYKMIPWRFRIKDSVYTSKAK
ncbi:MAG: DNA-3-methyladenine glycosylase [Chitinophagales bacterium]|nr:DNA-3-methyladenine glycosylase [Chitinophagales bacterium]